MDSVSVALGILLGLALLAYLHQRKQVEALLRDLEELSAMVKALRPGLTEQQVRLHYTTWLRFQPGGRASADAARLIEHLADRAREAR